MTEKTTNVLNVGNFIRGLTDLKVSPSFVDEAMENIKIMLDDDVYKAVQMAKGEGMKTIQDKHLINVYNFKLPDKSRLVSCGHCGRSFMVGINDAERKMTCPFCVKKGKMVVG